ncbi:putative Zn-dependent protease [Anoxybacillus tepidamans]|uniref:Putative Zn-dependent protease n=1 Tax=Anoxybacteroides tepidamans TaxID=265948 RepID=A0A7W8IQG4_9BACL|nr:LysM domain-containing protein [Anoxybacillus tepidamans]MBB5324724.1 putative Zn-dependent protease [Anoxybacillus tepidamans]
MKKLLSIFMFCLIIYTVYHDVTKGTLPTFTEKRTVDVRLTKTKTALSISYEVIKVKAGDTLLSMAERKQGGPLPVSIETLINDFESLNPGVKASSLQIGKTYKIPVYQQN